MPNDWILQMLFHLQNQTEMPPDIMPVGITGMTERFRKVLYSLSEFHDIPTRTQTMIWHKNAMNACSLFCVRMESAKTAMEQIALLLSGVQSKDKIMDLFP